MGFADILAQQQTSFLTTEELRAARVRFFGKKEDPNTPEAPDFSKR